MTIVALIDFSAVTDRVFETAASLADSLNGRVLLLHVVQPPADAAVAASADDQAADKRLARYEKRLHLDRLNVSRVLLRGEPVPQIREWCARHRVGFLVMGTHGLNLASGRLVGETAEGLLRRPPCPVILVPHPRLGRTRAPWPGSPPRNGMAA
jgi:nucleotide-binding universal stress UspA family protein